MFAALLGLMSPSWAEPLPTLFLPSAHPAEAMSGSAALGVSGVVVPGDWAAFGPTLDASFAPTQRWGLELHAPAYWMTSSGGSNGRPSTGGGLVPMGLVGLPTLGARFVAVDTPAFHLAPTAMVGGLASTSTTGDPLAGMLVLGGLAMEGGWERVRLDASLSLLGLSATPAGLLSGTAQPWLPWIEYNSLVFTELGVGFQLTPEQRLRVGLVSMVPAVTWRYTQPRWYVEANVASVGFANLFQAQAGVRL